MNMFFRYFKIKIKTIVHNICIVFFIFGPAILSWSQSNERNLLQNTKVKNWGLTKIDGKKDNITKTIEEIISNGIMPQAIDRNNSGDFLILSQKTPPAPFSKTWELRRYKSEREMIEDMKKLSLDKWVPHGFDVQVDGAFVQYVQDGLVITNSRIIKINDSKKIASTLKIYRDINFIPAGISTYKDELWFLFAQYKGISASDFEIVLKSGSVENIDSVIYQGLSSSSTKFIDMTITDDNKVIILFINRLT